MFVFRSQPSRHGAVTHKIARRSPCFSLCSICMYVPSVTHQVGQPSRMKHIFNPPCVSRHRSISRCADRRKTCDEVWTGKVSVQWLGHGMEEEKFPKWHEVNSSNLFLCPGILSKSLHYIFIRALNEGMLKISL